MGSLDDQTHPILLPICKSSTTIMGLFRITCWDLLVLVGRLSIHIFLPRVNWTNLPLRGGEKKHFCVIRNIFITKVKNHMDVIWLPDISAGTKWDHYELF